MNTPTSETATIRHDGHIWTIATEAQRQIWIAGGTPQGMIYRLIPTIGLLIRKA